MTLWDGSNRTAYNHIEWALDHVRAHTLGDVSGFRDYGEHHGVTYEIHDGLTAAGEGAGYFRLSADLDVAPAAFASLVMDAPLIGEMDETVRALDFVTAYPDGQTWLCYWRAAPGFPFWDVDGLDLSAVSVLRVCVCVRFGMSVGRLPRLRF